MEEIKSGMFVQHKFRKSKSYRVTFIKDHRVFLNSLTGEFWFLDNVIPSKNIFYKILNFLKFKKWL